METMQTQASLAVLLDPNNQQVQAYRQKAPELLALAHGLQIRSDADLHTAAEHTQASSAAVKAIKKLFKPANDALNEAKKAVAALEDGLVGGFEIADTILRQKITAYHSKRQREAQEEARRRQEEETRAREAAQLEQASRLEVLANATGDEHFRAVAEAVLTAPVRTAVVPVEMPKAKGLSFRDETSVDVTDLDVLISAVASGQVSRQALLANTSWLRTEAVQRGTTIADGDVLFPGVVVRKMADVTVRTR